MRAYFRSTEIPMRFARATQYVFPHLKLGTAQEWAAQLLGYRNWYELVQAAGPSVTNPTPLFASPPDEDEDEGEALSAWERASNDWAHYQFQTLGQIVGPAINVIAAQELAHRIMVLANLGGKPPKSSIDKMNLGSGQPFFRLLQQRWMGPEPQAEDGLGNLVGYFVPVGGGQPEVALEHHSGYVGFDGPAMARRWLDGLYGVPEAETKQRLRSGDDDDVEDEIVLHTPQTSIVRAAVPGGQGVLQAGSRRFWAANGSDRMLGGCSLDFRFSATPDSSDHDLMEFTIGKLWAYPGTINMAVTKELMRLILLRRIGHFLGRLFLCSRIGMPAPAGKAVIRHDGRPSSAGLAAAVHAALSEHVRADEGYTDLATYLAPL